MLKYEVLNLVLMKKNYIKEFDTILPAIAAGVLLVGILSFGQSGSEHVLAQNATTPTNQTAGNATAPNTSGLGNLTIADFSEVRADFESVREALFNNDTTTAYSALSWAKNGLFELANGEDRLKDSINQQFSTVRSSIDSAQESLLNNDRAGALEGLNNADVQLVRTTQGLHLGEEEGEAEEEGGEAE
jgi:hypothetical protein